jgi:hypothetical protein
MIYNKIMAGLLWGISTGLLGCIFIKLLFPTFSNLNVFIISLFTIGFIRGYANGIILNQILRLVGIDL